MKRERTTKTMRTILAAFLAAGAAAFLASAPVSAANPAGFILRVTPNTGADTQAPNAVTNSFQAAPDSNTDGRVILTWNEPADNPSGNVASYEVFYATVPVSVAGSTTAWLALATAATGEPAPSGAPGSPEIPMVVNNLNLATTYYFAIRSRDASNNVSPLDDKTVFGPLQASAYPKNVRPAPVAGLLADVFPIVTWSDVLQNEDGSAFNDRDGTDPYEVRRSTSLNSFFSVVVSSGAGASGFTASVAPSLPTEYMMVVARDQAGNESDPALSNILQVTQAGIIGQIALAQDGTVSRSYVPSTIMGELAARDLLMRVAPNVDPNVNRDPRVLASYDVSFVSPVQVVDKNFTLSRPAMNVVLQSASPITAGSVGVLWWNGTAWVKLSVDPASVDDINNTVSFNTALPGLYQIRTFQAATTLTLDKSSVFPRIFTPNGDGSNDQVLFVINNPNNSPVDGKIYDMGGNEVATLSPDGAAPASSYAWNGRDRNGQLVPAGVYIYRIKGEGKSMTGTVVVAK